MEVDVKHIKHPLGLTLDTITENASSTVIRQYIDTLCRSLYGMDVDVKHIRHSLSLTLDVITERLLV